MKKLMFCVAAGLLLLAGTSAAKTPEQKYRVADIPKELLTDAKAVIRFNEELFEISAVNKAVYKRKFAVTVLNQNGLDQSVFTEFYNKFLTVKKVEWNLFDSEGNPVKNNAAAELEDYSAIAGYSLYEDSRVKYMDPKYRTTPFTIEFSYEVSFNGLLFFPDWNPYPDFNTSVESSLFVVTVPAGYSLRFLEKNLLKPCTKSSSGSRLTYSWVAGNLPAIRDEAYGLPLSEFTPQVYIAGTDFELDGRPGKMETWDEFGKWIYALGDGRDVLPPETVAKIKTLVNGLGSDAEKVDAIYRFMQEKVRYINITVGIGGWQTLPAETVDRLSYGDCKALSNYMKALLKAAGIESYTALVKAGRTLSPINSDFPSNQFNHVIVCVPAGKDSIWLECTNQHLPTGYLGTFTDDRDVLLVTPEGGRITRTVKYSGNDNLQSRKTEVRISTDGSATATVLTKYSGMYYDDLLPVILSDLTDRKKSLQRRINIKSFEISNFSHREIRNRKPVIEETLDLKINGFGAVIGTRMLINPNLMTRVGVVPPRGKERKSGMRIRREYVQSDTVTVKLPLGYKTDQLPEKVNISTVFGEYSAEFINGSNEIKYIRRLKFNMGEYPASQYADFVTFLEKVAAADEKKVPLIKVI